MDTAQIVHGTIPLAAILLTGGTRIRAAVSQDLATDYAARMLAGAIFPPVVVFLDGDQYYLADGFHRVMASRLAFRREISAAIYTGTRDDALWFALGANSRHGQRLTAADHRHAILLAFRTWPERSAREVAEQLGCTSAWVSVIREQVHTTMHLPERVIGKDGKSYPARRQRAGRDAVGLDDAGHANVGVVNRSHAPVQQQRDQQQDIAVEGLTPSPILVAADIAAAVGPLHSGHDGIDTQLKRTVGQTKRNDPARYVGRIVMDAEDLTANLQLIDVSSLPLERFGAWAESLDASQKALRAFMRRLRGESKRRSAALPVIDVVARHEPDAGDHEISIKTATHPGNGSLA